MPVGDEGQMPCCYLSRLGLADRLDYSHYGKVCKKNKKSVERESKRFAGPKPSEPIAAMDLWKFNGGRSAASITCFVLLSAFMSIHLHTEVVVFTSLAHTTFLGQDILTPKVRGLLKSVTPQAESLSRVEKLPWD